MPSVRVADFDEDNAAIREVRFAVFVAEQGVPADIEIDDRDAVCLHVLALEDGAPVGTARLDVAKDGKVGRLAVLAPWRGKGVGSALMAEIHELARRRGLARVWCHAQVAAAPFYERLGYRASGGVFDEAGIPHVHMDRSL